MCTSTPTIQLHADYQHGALCTSFPLVTGSATVLASRVSERTGTADCQQDDPTRSAARVRARHVPWSRQPVVEHGSTRHPRRDWRARITPLHKEVAVDGDAVARNQPLLVLDL